MSAITDLRDYLKLIKSENLLIEIEREVNPKLELASVARKIETTLGKAVLFKNVKGYSIPVVTNLLSSMDLIKLALKVEKKQDVLFKIIDALEHPIKHEVVSEGPVKEKIIREPDSIDLLKLLPIPVHALKDSGHFITAGIVISKDPENGRQNLSYHRMEVKGPRKLGIHIDPWRHIGEWLEKAESKNEPLDIAIAIGVDPVIEMAAAARIPYDEMELAGALRGAPIKLTKAETVDIDVPACAEIVIEGKILPKIREDEGPFAEFTGYYGMGHGHPVVEVTAITMRKNPIYRTIVGASMEHLIVGNVISREPILYNLVKHVDPNVKAVHIPPYSAGFHAIISTKKKIEGLAKNIIFAALASHINIKHVIVVDDDVDIFDPKDVMWAIATRVQADKDVFVVPNAFGHPLDRTSQNGITAKMGIDATKPLDRENEFERVSWLDVDLSKYLETKEKKNQE